MFKYLFVFVIFFSLGAHAQFELHDETINVEISAPKDNEREIIYLPECDEKVVLDLVKNKIKEYQAAHPAKSIIEKRKQAMINKNLQSFSDVSIKDFDTAKSFSVSAELVATKINRNLKNEDMRLCVDNNSLMYLLMYPEGDNEAFRIQIINFMPRAVDGNTFSVLYEPNS